MTNAWVQAPPDSTGKKFDTEAITTSGGTTVHVPWMLMLARGMITTGTTISAAQTDTALVSFGATNRFAVTQVQVALNSACTVAVAYRIGFGTALTPRLAGRLISHPGMVPGSIHSRGDGTGTIGLGAANEDIRITCDAPTGGSLDVVITYYGLGAE